MPDLIMGIDAGSSVLKAAVFDTSGNQLSVASRRTPLQRPHPGWVEADPETCLSALDQVIAEAAKACGQADAISAIGISAAMVGAWLVDRDGQALRPGINWEDSRSGPMLDAMAAENPNVFSHIFSISGSVLQQGCTLPVLAWLQQGEPETLAKTAHVISYKDFLRHHMTGAIAGDRSEAAVLPGDARKQDRSPELMELFGISDLTPLLPPVHASDEIVGHLLPQAAARTGLLSAIPVIAGAGDVIANVIGAGGLQAGAATAILGTTCMVGVCHDEPVFTPPDLGLLFSLPERHWYRAMVNVAGTLNLDWAIRLVAPDLVDDPDLFAKVTEMVSAKRPGANGVTYLPYLSESGIIAPVVDPAARAQFSGLHSGHERADIVRAVYEGVGFAIADLVDNLGVGAGAPVTLTGGGSRSALWCQMIADITNRTILVPHGDEFGARGAALLAAKAIGVHDSVIAASRMVRGNTRRYDPAENAASVWATPRARFLTCRDRLLD